jgi:hypothetical protein
MMKSFASDLPPGEKSPDCDMFHVARPRGMGSIARIHRAPAGHRPAGGGSGRAAGWLCLAAAPTFALMALLTAVSGGRPVEMLCMSGHGSLLGGMVPMYLLMSAFHAAPWLRLLGGRAAGHSTGAISRPR